MESFQFVEADDIDRLCPYFEMRDNWSCSNTFLDSFLWRDLYDVRFRIVNGEAAEFMMKGDDEAGEIGASMPQCSAENLPFYLKDMEVYFNEELHRKLLVYYAEGEGLSVLHLDPEKYSVTEMPNAADYIYDAKSLRELSGKAYHKKKNHVNAFMREYEGRYEYRTLSEKDADDIWNFLMEWEEHRDGDYHLTAEAKGIRGVLDHYRELSAQMAQMGGVYIDGKLEAFSIGSYNRRMKMAVIHIEKANPEINGLYAFINQQLQVHEYPDAVLVNREDDMGLPGLKKAKESYHPIRMEKKYIIRQL